MGQAFGIAIPSETDWKEEAIGISVVSRLFSSSNSHESFDISILDFSLLIMRGMQEHSVYILKKVETS